MAEIISTTKDLLDDATNVPNTASDIEEEEDTEVEVEHKYIIKVNDDTIDNNVVGDDGGFKDSNTVQARDVDRTLDGEGMVELFARGKTGGSDKPVEVTKLDIS